MKKKISLSKLTAGEMKELEAGYVVYGDDKKVCGCGCYYANSGGSSTTQNRDANYLGGLTSPLEP